jgi:hypothetical protein
MKFRCKNMVCRRQFILARERDPGGALGGIKGDHASFTGESCRGRQGCADFLSFNRVLNRRLGEFPAAGFPASRTRAKKHWLRSAACRTDISLSRATASGGEKSSRLVG